MSLFCGSLSFRFFRSIEIDFLSNFNFFLDTVICRCLWIIILIIIVIVITVVHVIAFLLLISTISRKEFLSSSSINCASRSTWFDLLLLFWFRCLSSTIRSWWVLSNILWPRIGLTRVTYPSSCLRLWIKLQMLSVLVIVCRMDYCRILSNKSPAIVQIFKSVYNLFKFR